MIENPEKSLPDPGYDCAGLPDHEVPALDLLTFFRSRVGDDIVNEQIAVLGVDRVLESMERAQRAHLMANSLTDKQLHQRAELLESLMLELGVPALGSSEDTMTDVDRVQLFIRVVKRLADMAAEQSLRDDVEQYITYDEDDEDGPDEVNRRS